MKCLRAVLRTVRMDTPAKVKDRPRITRKTQGKYTLQKELREERQDTMLWQDQEVRSPTCGLLCAGKAPGKASD